MAGIAEIAVGLGAAAKLLKSLKDLVTTPDAKAQVIELYDVILTTQSRALENVVRENTMLEEIRDLKEKLGRVETWEGEKRRYQIARQYGVTFYALTKAMSNGEAPHYICANCYQNGKRAMLQQVKDKDGFLSLTCAACRSQGYTRLRGLGDPKYAEELSNEA